MLKDASQFRQPVALAPGGPQSHPRSGGASSTHASLRPLATGCGRSRVRRRTYILTTALSQSTDQHQEPGCPSPPR